jgi:hypothetical protein
MARKALYTSIGKDTDKEAKPSKYLNKKTELHGITFDSQKEANRYQELLWMQRAGMICNIECQPRYDLIVNGKKCGFYKADFRYENVKTGEKIVEDVKHPKTRTAVYALKKKLVKALYDIDIIEV